MTTPWYLPTCPPPFSRAKRRWRGYRQARRQRERRRGHGIRFRISQLHRWIGARIAARRQHVLSDEVPRHLRAHGSLFVTADEVKDPHSLQVRLWVNGSFYTELQHQRHGAQNPPLHRMGNVHPYARAGQRPGHGNQSPRPEPVPGRRLSEARNRALGRLHMKIRDDFKRTGQERHG